MIGEWYAGVRVLHILFAAFWVGSAAFLTLYVTPAIRATGPQGAPVMAELMRRRMGGFIAAAATLTLLSGLWMYWIFTGGFDGAIVAHGAGLALGIGGLCGIAAAVIGGAVIGRAADRAGTLSQQVAQMPEGEQRAATLQTIAGLQRRVATFSRLAVLLLIAALVAMALAHAL
ncbi:MAG TPA: hypothetical protein VHA71_04330 [Rhodanobacteraceae bacterium]|jgi:hypothetical protein|nr:hypothetical protein [Rhodanobacteraceae bacterium]